MKKAALIVLVCLCCLLTAQGEEEIHYSEVPSQAGQTANVNTESGGETVEERSEPAGEVIHQEDGSVLVTLTAVGDITVGRNVQYSGKSIFVKELEKQGNDPNFIFRNVKDIFASDSVTIANFEGVLAETYKIPSNKRNNDFLFLAPPEYARVLRDNSIEMVTIENNHIRDFGEDGLDSTRNALDGQGICWADAEHISFFEVSGFKIALLAYQTLNQPLTSKEMVPLIDQAIRSVRDENDLVVVYFHWGEELDYTPRKNQIELGRAAIDSGADLVLGAHSHRINPIECYQGRYIVYSLANCSFAGNNKPSDMYTFIFQTRFKFKNGEIQQNMFRIIPCRISSRKDYNDFAITPLTEQTNIDTVINTLKTSGKNLAYAVDSYPMEWE